MYERSSSFLPAAAATTATVVTTAATATAAATTSTTLAGGAITVTIHIGSRPLALDIIELLVELNSLAIVKTLEAILVDGGKVNENVLTSISGGDETESLVAEKLDSSLQCHLIVIDAECLAASEDRQ
jgi:hypothetical protein